MPHRDRWTPDRVDYRRDDYGYERREARRYRDDDYDDRPDFEDYGQADYSEDFGYDARSRTGYRRSDPEERRLHEDRYYDPRDDDYERRSFMDQARDFLGVNAYQDRRDDRRYRRGRVIWAVINGRLDHERGLDARDIEVIVDGSEVTLNGAVRSREEKRLAEDLADVRGVTHIQNNLRVGRRGFWR